MRHNSLGKIAFELEGWQELRIGILLAPAPPLPQQPLLLHWPSTPSNPQLLHQLAHLHERTDDERCGHSGDAAEAVANATNKPNVR